MKIRLSMPSTTSMTTRVANASQAAGSESRTMMSCMAGSIMWPRSASIQPFLSAAEAAKPAADVFTRRASAAHSQPRHRLPVGRGLRVGRQHARHRPAAGAACRHLPCHGGRGLDRRHRLPVRQRRVRAGVRPVRRPLRHDAGGKHRLHRRGPLLRPERARGLAGLAHPRPLPDRRHQLGDHSARHRLGGRQCRLRAPPGDAWPAS